MCLRPCVGHRTRTGYPGNGIDFTLSYAVGKQHHTMGVSSPWVSTRSTEPVSTTRLQGPLSRFCHPSLPPLGSPTRSPLSPSSAMPLFLPCPSRAVCPAEPAMNAFRPLRFALFLLPSLALVSIVFALLICEAVCTSLGLDCSARKLLLACGKLQIAPRPSLQIIDSRIFLITRRLHYPGERMSILVRV